ncbi:DNA-directed DNA polymerase [Cuniculiplasma sp. SKW4]|uniref:DNA-directed DNA polymerase n=1 Tax=Cuniculiplasma sp. SKW4 TaxID=3400171 RepID=UPI003FD5B02F
MRIKMRIIAASYRLDDIRVELFGRMEDGRSVTVLCGGFDPYFDVIEPTDAEIRGIKNNPEFKRMESKKLWYDGQDRNIERIYITHPYKVPEIRKLFVSRIAAADIPFHHRFIYDHDLGSCIEVEGTPVEKPKYSTDITIETSWDGIKNVEDFNPPVRILSFDIENAFPPQNNEEYGRILIIGYSISNGKNGELEKGCLTGSEEEVLRNFNQLVYTVDPDILIGYNIDGYDLPVIEYRMSRYNLTLDIGRDRSKARRVNGQFWRTKGRIISDVWWNVKKYLHPKHETLNFVAQELLGEGKDDVDRLRIVEEYENRPQEVIDYCIKDADLTRQIMEKMRVVERNMFMSTVTKLPLEDTTNGGTSNYVDSLLIRLADRRGIAVPMTSSSNLKDKAIEGGHVESIGAGLYDMVIVLDFKSMYPSMIMKYNICFSTLSPQGSIVSPTGARFLDPSVKRGIVPELLKSLMDRRDEVKRAMKSSSGEQKAYLDGVQNALKILMNTFYGVLASAFYRFTNPELGASVTAFARETIMKLIEDLKKNGYRVIYGDTDSVFIESKKKSVNEAIDLGKKLSEQISKELQVTIEFEKIMDPFFSHGAKKRYVGTIVYPEQDKGQMLVRGYEVRRTDSFDLQSEALQTVFDFLMKRNIEGAREYSEDIVKRLLRGDRTLGVEKLVISRSVKDEDSYANADSLASVRAARKLQERGERFIPGMKVSWIVTDSSRTPQEVEPYIDGEEFKYEPDWNYYARRVEETVNRVLESLGTPLNLASVKKTQKKTGDNRETSTLDSFF